MNRGRTKRVDSKTYHIQHGTAANEAAKYLDAPLTPLGNWNYNLNTEMFIMEIMEKIPDGHKMVSFDIISPFTRVPLDETIEIILKKAYIEKKIKTYIMKSILKELLCICTK